MKQSINKSENKEPYFCLHHILEWVSCQKRAMSFFLGAISSVHYSATLRESCRVFSVFVNRPKKSGVKKDAHTSTGEKHSEIEDNPIVIRAADAKEAHRLSLRHLNAHAHAHQTIVGITLLYNGTSILIPEMTWNSRTKTWRVDFCTASTSLRKDTSIAIAFCWYVLEKLDIAISKFYLNCYRPTEERSSSGWKSFEITEKIRKRVDEYKEIFDSLIALQPFNAETLEILETLEPCDRQYCEYCSKQESVDIDSVATLRKSKHFIEELRSQNIERFADIPATYKLNSIQRRQIESVKENSIIVVKKELEEYTHTLAFPRYYLDFEAYNMAIPNIKGYKNWDFIPFLFSLQWQDKPDGNIQSFLWAMQPGYDKRGDMWEQLCLHLANAGSIIVFGSEFETRILTSLGTLFGQDQESKVMLEKISDLQEPFSKLSIYHPYQRGKIALKTLAQVWFNDSQSYRIQGGIEANYYYLKLTDEVQMTFERVASHPYHQKILQEADTHSPKRISLKDIAYYCKRDTEIMIRLVQLIESKQ